MSTDTEQTTAMTLSEELLWRGFYHQSTFTSPELLDKEKRTLYFGVDPSADSMQVGNLAAAMMVRVFLKHGYKAVLLIGGATGAIGDPDGKSEERELKSLEEVSKNVAGITSQYKTVFAGKEFEIVDNYTWFKDMGYLDFLREIGKHFSMTQLLDREFVQSRIGLGGKGISYAEFSYSLIQGYDFLHLYRDKGATLQLCGADQWGNSVAGIGLIRKLEKAEAHVWSMPIIMNKSTGKKFGKSEDGAVWLSSEKTSAYKFYQFWLNADDDGVEDYLKIFTTMSPDEIAKIMQIFKEAPHERHAQKQLAFAVTEIVHGAVVAQAVVTASEVISGKIDFMNADHSIIELIAKEIPTLSIDAIEGKPGRILISEVLVQRGLASSRTEATRLIKDKAISINNSRISEDDYIVSGPVLIKRGKKSDKVCIVL